MVFTRGNKDYPLWVTSASTYSQILQKAENMYVILYDTVERRAWFLDGASALLHLTCAQLQAKPYCNTRLFKLDQFIYADSSIGGAKSALENPKNKELKVEEGDSVCRIETKVDLENGTEIEKREQITERRPWFYKNLVEQTWTVLEQMYAYQQNLLNVPAIGIRFTSRDQLEGYRFMDIVDSKLRIRPRMAYLELSGRGWVDFTRNIGAIALFGQGFGHLIEPRPEVHGLCKLWKHVPFGKDYLVAKIDILQNICKEEGEIESTPLQLAPGIYWHKAHQLFEPCVCPTNSACDIVQVLLPQAWGKNYHPDPFKQLDGAVIFGKSKCWF